MPGTGKGFIPHTGMNEHPSRSKRSSVKRHRSPIELRNPKNSPKPNLSPARQLLVCLGWLRLFQSIISPRTKSARTQAGAL